MKRIACMMLFMLLMLFATALCEQPVPCYWQLRAVEVETSASDALEASALTDTVPLSGLDAEGMFRALPSSLAMSLSAARPGHTTHSQGTYTFSGLPALAPGAASIRLLLTSSMPISDDSLYLYATASVNGQRLLRVRDSGAWIIRIAFPRQALAGTVREVRLHAEEINGFADVNVGEPLLYINSLDCVAVAINQGSFSKAYNIGTGITWRIALRKAPRIIYE